MEVAYANRGLGHYSHVSWYHKLHKLTFSGDVTTCHGKPQWIYSRSNTADSNQVVDRKWEKRYVIYE